MCKCTAKRQKIYFKSFFIQESSLDPLQDIYKLTVVYFNQLLDACSTQKLLGVDSQNLKKKFPLLCLVGSIWPLLMWKTKNGLKTAKSILTSFQVPTQACGIILDIYYHHWLQSAVTIIVELGFQLHYPCIIILFSFINVIT